MDELSEQRMDPAGSGLSPDQLVRSARGFNRLLWGIPLCLLLYTDSLTLHILPRIRVPSYVLGSLVMYWGLISLHMIEEPVTKWKSLVRWGLGLIFMHLYFAPFVYWWKRMPDVDFYMLNMFALSLSMQAMLYITSRLASRMGLALGDKVFRIESNLVALTVIMLSVLPTLLILVYIVLSSIRFETSLFMEVESLHLLLSRWLFTTYLLPVCLTMVMAWRAKERCILRLKYDATRALSAV